MPLVFLPVHLLFSCSGTVLALCDFCCSCDFLAVLSVHFQFLYGSAAVHGAGVQGDHSS